MTTNSILIEGARIIDPESNIDTQGDILIIDGLVKEVSSTPLSSGIPATITRLNAKGFIATPGWIDMHTHLRDPGFPEKETFSSGLAAAIRGGFTSIAIMANTHPVHDNPLVTHYIHSRLKELDLISVYPIGSITKNLEGNELSDIYGMHFYSKSKENCTNERGIYALSDDGNPVQCPLLFKAALSIAKDLDLLVINHAEDSVLKGAGLINEGKISIKLGIRGTPSSAETVQIARDIFLAHEAQARIHIPHLSTRMGLELVRFAREMGIHVSCEVTPHHLLLTETFVEESGPFARVAPPLRSEEDRESLLEGLSDGTIDVLATDHAPHTHHDKHTLSYEEACCGFSGLETALPTYLDLVHKKKLTLRRLISLVTEKPRQILKLPNKGTLKKGYDGDVTIFHPTMPQELTKDLIRSKSLNYPFLGQTKQGRLMATISKGRILFEETTKHST